MNFSMLTLVACALVIGTDALLKPEMTVPKREMKADSTTEPARLGAGARARARDADVNAGIGALGEVNTVRAGVGVAIGERAEINTFHLDSKDLDAKSHDSSILLQKNVDVHLNTPPANGCELPAGATWCTARSGDQSWEMAVYSGPDPVSNKICSSGTWEHSTPNGMVVSAGTQLLDIGANVGWYTFMFAKHGYNVLAVEPMTANRALINATLCKNPDTVSKITVAPAALTDKVDEPGQKCSIFSANVNLGDGMLACSPERIAELHDKAHNNEHTQHVLREQVPLTTLDQLLASSNINRVDVVKMDVERFECHVLNGGSTLFSRFRPKSLMIETDGKTNDCTVNAVMKGGSYKIHAGSIEGAVVEKPTGGGIGNLYFSLGA